MEGRATVAVFEDGGCVVSASDQIDHEWFSDVVPLADMRYWDGNLIDSQGRKVASIAWGTDTTDFVGEVDDLHGAAIAEACQKHAEMAETIAKQAKRIAKLEGLGPLIRRALTAQSHNEQLGIESRINAILQGGEA